MKIGMWSDSVNFPNLPLMKLSSYEEYVPRKDGKSCKELYPEILNKKEIFIMPTKSEKAAAPAERLSEVADRPVEVPASRCEEDRQEHSPGIHVLRVTGHCSLC